MKVALDCNALIAWSSGRDSDDGARLGALFGRDDVRLVVPMPAFAEFVLGARGDDVQWLDAIIGRGAHIKLAPFGRRAAYECAQVHAQIDAALHKRKIAMPRGDAWQHAKFDRQILAIALVEGCQTLVSGDKRLARDSRAVGLECVAVSELDLPPSAAQRPLNLDDPDMSPPPD